MLSNVGCGVLLHAFLLVGVNDNDATQNTKVNVVSKKQIQMWKCTSTHAQMSLHILFCRASNVITFLSENHVKQPTVCYPATMQRILILCTVCKILHLQGSTWNWAVWHKVCTQLSSLYIS